MCEYDDDDGDDEEKCDGRRSSNWKSETSKLKNNERWDLWEKLKQKFMENHSIYGFEFSRYIFSICSPHKVQFRVQESE